MKKLNRNRIIVLSLITMLVILELWIDIAMIRFYNRTLNLLNHGGKTFSSVDLKISRVVISKMFAIILLVLFGYLFTWWAILKKKRILLIGICIFFALQSIQFINLIIVEVTQNLPFTSILLSLGFFLARCCVVYFLIRIILSLNHPKMELQLTKKYDSSVTYNRNLHIYIGICLILGFPYLYELINGIYSGDYPRDDRYYSENFSYLAVLLIYLVSIILKNRMLYLTFGAIIVFTLSQFHQFTFNLIYNFIYFRNSQNNATHFSMWILPLYKTIAYFILFILTIWALNKVRSHFQSLDTENKHLLDS